MVKSSCQPLNCETTSSTYSTGWGMLAAPYLMAARGDAKAVALVSMLAVLETLSALEDNCESVEGVTGFGEVARREEAVGLLGR